MPNLDLPELEPVEPAATPVLPAVPALFEPPEPAVVGLDAEVEDYRYEKIETKFETAPHSWQLARGGLVVTRAGQSREIAYSQVTRLTLRFAPTRFQKRRYAMRVQARDGANVEIDNMSFTGIGNFEDRSFKYALLVHGLSQKLSAAGSACAVAGRVSWPYYAVSVGVSGFVLAIVLLTILVGGPILILIKVAVMVAYLPTLWRWIKRNRPVRGTLTALPPGTVPPLIA